MIDYGRLQTKPKVLNNSIHTSQANLSDSRLASPIIQSSGFRLQCKSACVCGGGCPRCQKEQYIQPKLKIGAANDKYEQEADRVADQVMRMPSSKGQTIKGNGIPAEGSADVIQHQDETEKERSLYQAKAKPGHISSVNPAIHTNVQSIRGRGQPLPNDTRVFFESRMGQDFNYVRIHTDSKAADLAESVNARAFTYGADIVFNKGQFASESHAGRRLLAHELTHVVQQKRHRVLGLQRFSVDNSCGSSDSFAAEQTGNMQCQNGQRIPNNTIYQLNFASLPNRCPEDAYNEHSTQLIERATQRAIELISSPNRPKYCLREDEFRRGVLNILQNTTIRCVQDRDGPASANIFSNTIYLRHGNIFGDDRYAVESLAGFIFHEALHIWEGRIGFLQHTGIVTPCTAACFPRSGQAMVNTDANDCVMPPLVRGSTLSVGVQGETTRGGGLGTVLSYRQSIFNVLHGHLSGQLGIDVSYEHLFSPKAQRRYGSDVLRASPAAGLTFRPGVLDRRGLVFNLDVGPSLELNRLGAQAGFRFNLGAGMEFDFLSIGAGAGVIVPLSDEAQSILDFSVKAGVSF